MIHLRCPICYEKLLAYNGFFKCCNQHHYDQAKAGYLYLSRKQNSQRGDNKQSITNRQQFLMTGHYDLLAQKISDIIQSLNSQSLLDMACGSGYYLNYLKKRQPHIESFGLDLSKEGIKVAAKNDKSSQYVIASMRDMPFFATSFDTLLTVFAPLLAQESVRILKEKGYWLIVEAGIYHLYELKAHLYESVRLNTVNTHNFPHFILKDCWNLKYQTLIQQPALTQLLEMTPYRYTSSQAALANIYQLKQLNVTLDFNITLLQKETL